MKSSKKPEPRPGIDAVIQRERMRVLYGFAKSERENIEPDETKDLRLIAAKFLAADEVGFARIIAQDNLQEIKP